jgi:hypothetical protein
MQAPQSMQPSGSIYTRGLHTSESHFKTRLVLLGMDAIGRADVDAEGVPDASIADYIRHGESVSYMK